MKPKLMHSVVLRLLILCLALPWLFTPQAARAATSHDRTRYSLASAQFTSADPSGCVITEVSIDATVEEFIDGGAPANQDMAYVQIARGEYCTANTYFYASGFVNLNPNEFTVDRQLSQASLDATVSLEEVYSGTTVPVEIHLDWIAAGDTSKYRNHYQVRTRNSKENETQFFKDSPAQAAGVVLIDGDNYTPNATDFGLLQTGRSYFSMVVQNAEVSPMADLLRSAASQTSLLTASAETGHLVSHGFFAFEDTETLTGCIRIGSRVTADDEMVGFATKPTRLLLVTVSVVYDDICNNQVFIRAVAQETVPPDALVFENGYAKATLDTTMVVTDYINGGSFPVDIHLTWTAVGDVTTERYTEYFDLPEFKSNFQSRFWIRDAQISGSVTGSGLNFLGETCRFRCLIGKTDLNIRTLVQGSN